MNMMILYIYIYIYIRFVDQEVALREVILHDFKFLLFVIFPTEVLVPTRTSGDLYKRYSLNVMCVIPLHTGTVLVRPEPVDNGRDDFRGPEFRRSGVSRREYSRKRGGLLTLWKPKCSSL